MDAVKEKEPSKINVKKVLKYSLLLAILGLAVFGLIHTFNQKPSQASNNTFILPVTRGNIIETIDGTGTLQAKEKETVTAKISGTIDNVYVNKGEQVESGQPLASISNNEILSQARQAQMQWEIDQYDLQTLLDPLSEADYQVRSAQLKIRQYELQLEDKLEEQEKLLLTVPFDGTLLALEFKEGQRINIGMEAATMVTSYEMEVVANFSDKDVSNLYEGMETQIYVSGLGKRYTGKILEIAPEGKLDGQLSSSTFEVIIKIDSPDDSLRSGMQTNNSMHIVNERTNELLMFIQAPGYVRYKETENIVAEASGKVEEIYSRPGDFLREGETILLLSNPDIERQILEIENQLAIAKEDLELLLTPEEIDIKRQKLKVEQSYSRFLTAQEEVNNLNIYAPFTGTVFDVFVKAGDEISKQTDQRLGEELLILTGIDKNLLEIQVDELDIGRLEIGQKAQVQVDALPGVVLEAEVMEIDQEALIQDGITKYIVTLEVDNAPGVRNGMTATAVITLEQRENVLQVPAEAIVNRNGVNMVQVMLDGEATYRPVQTGVNNGRFIEIIDGIEEGAEIVVASTTTQSGQITMPGMGMPGVGMPAGGGGAGGGGAGGGQIRVR